MKPAATATNPRPASGRRPSRMWTTTNGLKNDFPTRLNKSKHRGHGRSVHARGLYLIHASARKVDLQDQARPSRRSAFPNSNSYTSSERSVRAAEKTSRSRPKQCRILRHVAAVKHLTSRSSERSSADRVFVFEPRRDRFHFNPAKRDPKPDRSAKRDHHHGHGSQIIKMCEEVR